MELCFLFSDSVGLLLAYKKANYFHIHHVSCNLTVITYWFQEGCLFLSFLSILSNFLHRWYCHLQIKTVPAFPSQSAHIVFPFLARLYELECRLVLKRSGDGTALTCTWTLGKCSEFLIFQYEVSCMFLQIVFIKLKKISLYSWLFVMNELDFGKHFFSFSLCWYNPVIFLFKSLWIWWVT